MSDEDYPWPEPPKLDITPPQSTIPTLKRKLSMSSPAFKRATEIFAFIQKDTDLFMFLYEKELKHPQDYRHDLVQSFYFLANIPRPALSSGDQKIMNSIRDSFKVVLDKAGAEIMEMED